jgi:hypothetical protein
LVLVWARPARGDRASRPASAVVQKSEGSSEQRFMVFIQRLT